MRYISHYEEYPIYEPAEGGYYYPGNQLVASERKSKRACKKNLLEIWEECKQDNVDFRRVGSLDITFGERRGGYLDKNIPMECV